MVIIRTAGVNGINDESRCCEISYRHEDQDNEQQESCNHIEDSARNSLEKIRKETKGICLSRGSLLIDQIFQFSEHTLIGKIFYHRLG